MATTRTWTIKGVSDRTRAAVSEATQAEGLTIGEWIDRALTMAAEEALHPKPPAAAREDVAGLRCKNRQWARDAQARPSAQA